MVKPEMIETFLNGNRLQLYNKLNPPNLPKDTKQTVINTEELLWK